MTSGCFAMTKRGFRKRRNHYLLYILVCSAGFYFLVMSSYLDEERTKVVIVGWMPSFLASRQLVCEHRVSNQLPPIQRINFKIQRDEYQNPPMRKITATFLGRLGNQMFIYATLLGVAEQNNLIPVIPASSEISIYFNVSTEKYKGDFSTNGMMTVQEKFAATYDERMERLGDKQDVTLVGFLQSWKYFHRVNQKVRDQLKFDNQVAVAARTKFNDIIMKDRLLLQHCNMTFVGIHIRRGDMITLPKHREMGYVAADVNYFKRAMKYMRERFNNVLFIVATDSMQWAKLNLKGLDIRFTQPTNTAAVDMAILSMCNHTIQSTGTFSWWAAYLSGGISTYYRDFPRKNTFLSNVTKNEDYFYPPWVAL